MLDARGRLSKELYCVVTELELSTLLSMNLLLFAKHSPLVALILTTDFTMKLKGPE